MHDAEPFAGSGATLDFPLDARGWRPAMGMRPLDLATWLIRTPSAPRDLAYKATLIASAYDTVVGMTPEGENPSAELRELVDAFQREHGWDHHVDETAHGAHPIVTAALGVQEDLCVLTRTDQGWRLSAACVCFPSRWSLVTKLGCTMDEIHLPVPDYQLALATPTNRLFDRLSVERPMWRLNWTVLDTDELHLPDPHARRTPASGADLAPWWFRVERQTIRVLPKTRAIGFTISTSVRPLREVLDEHPARAALLANALRTAPEVSRRYKGWGAVADDLAATLSTVGPEHH